MDAIVESHDMIWERDEIDLSFIREFSTSGEQLVGAISSIDRRERIRVAILKNNRERLTFHDSHMTYAEAFRLCYGQPIERRANPRFVNSVQLPHIHAEDESDFEDDL